MTTLVVISDEDLEIGDAITPVLLCKQSSPAEVAAHLSTKEVIEPVVLLAATNRVGWLPRIARSQRAQGRRISGYLVIDPEQMSVSDEWPDAPVIAIVSGSAEHSGNLARLRGWRVVPYEPDDLRTSLTSAIEYFT